MNNPFRKAELKWYKKNGKYSDRIAFDSNGEQYVVGDFSWNRQNPKRQEFIEAEMFCHTIKLTGKFEGLY